MQGVAGTHVLPRQPVKMHVIDVMSAEDAESTRPVASLAAGLVNELTDLVEAASLHTEQELPELQGRLLSAGEDPALVIASISEIIAVGLVSEGADLPLELAVRARLVGERLAAGGIGLETLLELVQSVQREAEVLLLEQSPSARVAVAAVRHLNQVGGALTLTLARAYVETTFADYLAQERALRALITIARAVSRSLEPGDVIEAGLTETVSATNLDAGGVWLVAGSEDGISLQATTGLNEAEIALLHDIDITSHPEIAASIRSGVPVQLALDNDLPQLAAYKSALIVPLNGSHGLLGAMALGSREGRLFTPEEVIFTGAVADHMANALDHALEHRLEAHTDYLSGLANRAEFESTVRRELASAQRTRRPLTLVVMDLNRLKSINDGFGHHAGDEAIRTIGQVLRQVVRTSDISARLGGDEFGVAMPEAGLAQAQEVVARIRTSLTELDHSSGRPFAIELSYGIAEWEPGQDFVRLFEVADSHLYSDKRRNRIESASKIEKSQPRPDQTSSPRASSPETPST